MGKKKLNPGTDVVVMIPQDGQTNDPAIKLNGQMFKLKRKKMVTSIKWYWELEGAESEYGVPYGFCEETLLVL